MTEKQKSTLSFGFTFVLLFPSLCILALIHGLLVLDIYFLSPLWLLVLASLVTLGWVISFVISILGSGTVFSMFGESRDENQHLDHDDLAMVIIGFYGLMASFLNMVGWAIVYIRDTGLKSSDLEGNTTYRVDVYGRSNVVALFLYLGAAGLIVGRMHSIYVFKRSVQVAKLASKSQID